MPGWTTAKGTIYEYQGYLKNLGQYIDRGGKLFEWVTRVLANKSLIIIKRKCLPSSLKVPVVKVPQNFGPSEESEWGTKWAWAGAWGRERAEDEDLFRSGILTMNKLYITIRGHKHLKAVRPKLSIIIIVRIRI